MTYEKKVNPDGGIVYRVDGEMKSMYIKALHDDVADEVQKGSAAYFLFDFEKVEYVDSMAISLLVLAGKYNYGRGQDLTIRKTPDKIRRIIAIADIACIRMTN